MTKTGFSAFLFLAALAIGFFYVKPEWSRFADMRTESADLKKLSTEIDELAANRDELIKLMNSFTADELRRVELSLPQGADASNLLVSMEDLASRHGLAIRQLDIVEGAGARSGAAAAAAGQPRPGGITAVVSPSSGALAELPLVFNVSGSYEAFKRLLRDLERNLRIIDVQDLTFQSPSSPTGFSEFSMQLKTYYQ